MSREIWSDIANNSVAEQIRIALKLNVHIPEFTKLYSPEEIDRASLNSELLIREDYAFKKALGAKVGYAAYYNGERFVNYIGMVRERFQFAGNQGMELDDNILMIFGVDRKIPLKYFKKLEKILQKDEPEFIGFVQLNVFIDSDNRWWYDSIMFGAQPELSMCFRNLIGNDGCDYAKPCFFSNRYAASVRIFPYFWEGSELSKEEIKFITDIWEITPIENNSLFIASGAGNNIKDLWKNVYSKCSGVERFNYLYRVDGYDTCRKSFHDIKSHKLVEVQTPMSLMMT